MGEWAQFQMEFQRLGGARLSVWEYREMFGGGWVCEVQDGVLEVEK